MTADEMKQAAAAAAINYISPLLQPKSIVGVGTGSTANCFIEQLANIKHLFDATVASSEATATRLQAKGIKVFDPNSVASIDVYIDGADEFDPALHLIKGGGGALTREKIIAAAADEFICIVDSSKQVDILGNFPLPVEVIPMARSYVARELVKLDGMPVWREGFITDNGNFILDVHHLEIMQPVDLEAEINNIVGVVTNGLFANRKANSILMAHAKGVDTIK